MRKICALNLRLIGRSIDRSTGSPLTRWLLSVTLAALPLLMLAAGGSDTSLGQATSSSATVVNLLIVAVTLGALITVSITIAWRVDPRFLEIFEVSPLPTARWQFALLAPNMAIATWIALAASAPLGRDLARATDLGAGPKAIVLAAALVSAAAGVLGGTVLALVLRHGVARLPNSMRTTGRSIALLGASGTILWFALRFWTWTNDRIAEFELTRLSDPVGTASHPFDVAWVAAATLGVATVATALFAVAALRLKFTAIESSTVVPFASLRLGVAANPSSLGRCWLRSPHSASQLGLAMLVALVGLAVPDLRWLLHAAILLAATSFVGFAPGNVGMRAVVAVGAREPSNWFLINGVGAVVSWAGLLVVWATAMKVVGESVFETAVASTLIMAIALVAGGLFAYSYGTSYGAELANLVVYCVGAAVIIGLIERDVFGGSVAVVSGWTCFVVLLALLTYTWQSASDSRWRVAR